MNEEKRLSNFFSYSKRFSSCHDIKWPTVYYTFIIGINIDQVPYFAILCYISCLSVLTNVNSEWYLMCDTLSKRTSTLQNSINVNTKIRFASLWLESPPTLAHPLEEISRCMSKNYWLSVEQDLNNKQTYMYRQTIGGRKCLKRIVGKKKKITSNIVLVFCLNRLLMLRQQKVRKTSESNMMWAR